MALGHRPELGGDLDQRPRPGRWGGGAAPAVRRRGPAAAGRPPAGASAAWSAAPPRRSRACSPLSSSVSSSRLASTLVSGVRSSCEASATNSRWRSSIAWSRRARVQGGEHAAQRPRQLGDLVVGLGARHLTRWVAGALDLAGGVGELARSAASRGATRTGRPAGPGSCRRARRAAGRAARGASVWSTSDSGRRVQDVDPPDRLDRSSRTARRGSPTGCSSRRPRTGIELNRAGLAAPWRRDLDVALRAEQVAVGRVEHADLGVLGAGEVAQRDVDVAAADLGRRWSQVSLPLSSWSRRLTAELCWSLNWVRTCRS